MPRTIRNCLNKCLTFEKMIEAHERAKKGKMNRFEVLNFELNLESNIVNLVEKIKKGQYETGNYRSFVVHEPKTREIKALPYIDRVVHQWYVHEFIKPYLVPKFIKDTYACIDNRGTHKAVDTVEKYMRLMQRRAGNDYYILKMDIKKYFYTIDQEILYHIMNEYISEKKLLSFTKTLIFSEADKIGIPIGNYTSQFFANIYLDKLDKFIKHELKIRYYVRYMDDFVILIGNRDAAKKLFKKIEIFIENNLKLSLNHKSRYYPSPLGVNFCGYRIWNTHRLVRNRSKKKIKKQIKKWNYLFSKNKLDSKKFILSFNSWLGHIKHADSYNLMIGMMKKINFIDL